MFIFGLLKGMTKSSVVLGTGHTGRDYNFEGSLSLCVPSVGRVKVTVGKGIS